LLLQTFTSPLSVIVYIGIAVCVVYAPALSLYFMGDDFTWLRWAATAPVDAARDYFMNAWGFFYRPIPKILYQLLYSVFWLKPAAYHIVSIVMFYWLAALVYILQRKHNVRIWIALSTTLFFIVMSVHHEIVFWISTFSHALSAGMLFSALCVFDGVWTGRSRWTQLRWLLGILLTLASALSYEGGSIAAIVVVFIGVYMYEVRSRALLAVFVTAPLYWWMRSQAGAVGASGDYGVRPGTLVVNSVANTIGYVSAIFFGPKSVELFGIIRENLRLNVYIASAVAAVGGLTVAAKFYWNRHTGEKYRKSFIWMGACVLSMVPFLGLGGMTERYALVPSAFLIIAIGQAWETVMGAARA
ncbi:MAG: hypothetical protein AAB276_05650, partial [Pseudomonadota bacterium]